MDRPIAGVFSSEEWTGLVGDLDLSRRQAQIAGGLLAALGDKQLARELNISIHTVRTHLNRMFTKLEAQDRVELLMRLFREFRTGCPEGRCHLRH